MNERPKDSRPDMQDWEEQINDLLDGELSDAQAETIKVAAEDDQVLARAIIEAYQLQQAMAQVPQERAPASLSRKLNRIPREQKRLDRPAYLQPRWLGAMAVIPLVAAISINQLGPKEPTEAEIAQVQQDLALAFAYLGKASRKTGLTIESSIEKSMAEPVSGNTARALNEQFDLNKEQEA